MKLNDNRRSRKIRVLAVDDSAVVREVLHYVLSEDPEIEVVGTAPDPLVAREMIKALNPDVLTLDVEMSKMNGLEFLEKLMRLRPMPVVMISSHTFPGGEMSIRALEIGAVDVVGKNSGQGGLIALKDEIIAKVKAASRANIERATINAGLPRRPALKAASSSHGRIVAVGASTGGVQALNVLLGAMPRDCPPLLIVQHMPAGFTKSFARRLDRSCEMIVSEAEDGMPVLRGQAFIAPGDRHLTLAKTPAGYVCRVTSGPPINHHMPSIDVLFQSVAIVARRRAVGVVLTGMGKDGASGLDMMRKAGAPTICQDEASSLIYGMPKAALAIGAAEYELPLARIAHFILELPAPERRTAAMAGQAV